MGKQRITRTLRLIQSEINASGAMNLMDVITNINTKTHGLLAEMEEDVIMIAIEKATVHQPTIEVAVEVDRRFMEGYQVVQLS